MIISCAVIRNVDLELFVKTSARLYVALECLTLAPLRKLSYHCLHPGSSAVTVVEIKSNSTHRRKHAWKHGKIDREVTASFHITR